jgi:hypothetical protein
MNDLETALEKLKDTENIEGQKESAMAKPVAEALREFCGQNAEFAQAVAQGGLFRDCMKAVASGVGGSISDLEAYRKAVRFYFPGADVRFEMTIDVDAGTGARPLPPAAAGTFPVGKVETGNGGIVLNLTDFL